MPRKCRKTNERKPGRRSGRMNATRRDRRRTPPEIQVVRDAEEVFREAILAGALSAGHGRRDWAGNYLYMFHDESGTAWFKHRDTRAYVSMRARGRVSGGRS